MSFNYRQLSDSRKPTPSVLILWRSILIQHTCYFQWMPLLRHA